MTKGRAREYALWVLAAEVRHHIGNGSEWIERPLGSDNLRVDADGAFGEEDRVRVESAVKEIAEQLEQASLRLQQSRRNRELRRLDATSRRPSR